MVKITSIFGSYRFLRIAWHDIFLLSDLSDHFPASWNLYTMYPAVILRSRRENAHLLVNPIPKLTMVLIWKTPPCLKFGKTSNRDVKNLPQRKLWARSIQPKFRPVRPGKEDHLKRWTCFSKLFRLDRTDPLSFGPKFPEILVEWIAPFVFWKNKTVMAFWMLCHVWACFAVILESIAHFIIIILKSELSSLLLYSCFFYKLLNQDLNCFQCTILTFQKNATLNFSWAEPNSN